MPKKDIKITSHVISSQPTDQVCPQDRGALLPGGGVEKGRRNREDRQAQMPE